MTVMNQDFLEDMPSLAGIQLGVVAMEGVADIFEQYIEMLIKALPAQEPEEESKRKVCFNFSFLSKPNLKHLELTH